VKDINANMNSMRGVGGLQESTRTPSNRAGIGADNGFRDQLEALKGAIPTAGGAKPANVSALKFSNHAVERMQARGIRFSPEDMAKIESAVGKAAAKGAKNTLLLTDLAAMIVDVKEKNVVTVMDKNNLKENVFTNIDSTVMI
jgi:flagellar operon protein